MASVCNHSTNGSLIIHHQLKQEVAFVQEKLPLCLKMLTETLDHAGVAAVYLSLLIDCSICLNGKGHEWRDAERE